MEKLEGKQLHIWINGKSKENSFTIDGHKSVDSIRKLKEEIFYLKNFCHSYFDKTKIYNNKGIEIDDSDVPYLEDSQVGYISFDNNKFNNINYVNEYQTIKPLKQGGYAEVYGAKNVNTDKLVSIKKTDGQNFSSEELYNITREAIYLSNLIHKNIIKMYNSYSYNNYGYNVMEYAEGGELTEGLTTDEPIPESRIKDLFMQICNGVKFIHNKNVIHRDLKPNNIGFLDKEQTHLVIIDFGISGICNGKSREIVKAGTGKYLPPELVSGDEYQSSPKLDIWSLGVILYGLNFKQFPFDGNDDQVTDKIINEPLVFPEGNKTIKKSGVKLIEGLLKKNPNYRINITDPLGDEWFNDNSKDYYTNTKPKELPTQKKKNQTHMYTSPDTRRKENKNASSTQLPSYMKNTTCATSRFNVKKGGSPKVNNNTTKASNFTSVVNIRHCGTNINKKK